MAPVAAFTDVVPWPGGVVTETVEGTSEPPGLAALSLARELMVTAVLTVVVAKSVLATGRLFTTAGLVTTIVSKVVGHGGTWEGAHTGTVKLYVPATVGVNV